MKSLWPPAVWIARRRAAPERGTPGQARHALPAPRTAGRKVRQVGSRARRRLPLSPPEVTGGAPPCSAPAFPSSQPRDGSPATLRGAVTRTSHAGYFRRIALLHFVQQPPRPARRQVLERGSELGRLPPHHIRRPRLTTQCRQAGVVVVEAAAGYGKTVLGAELADMWRSVAIEVVLHEGGMPAELFAARLRTAASHAGFSEAAAAMAEAGEDATGAVDALLGALAGERCTFIVDDAHHAGRGAGLLIERLAEQLQPDQHLVILARRLPEGTARLRRADCVQLSAADLALRPDETLQLCRAGFGLDIGPAEVARLERATGGWTAATALAAARARRTGEDVSVLAAATDPDQPFSAVATILHEALDTLTQAERQLLAQVGRLPLIDAPTVNTATEIEGYFRRALAAGIPFTPGQDDWWDLPGPVRDYLATLRAPDPAVLRRAAGEYARRGQLGAALQLMLAFGDAGSAARMLSEGSPATIEALDVREFQAVIDRLPATAIAEHPALLLYFALSCE